MASTLAQRIKWALTKPEKPVKQAGKTVAQLYNELQKQEKEWGNQMIGQVNNGQ